MFANKASMHPGPSSEHRIPNPECRKPKTEQPPPEWNGSEAQKYRNTEPKATATHYELARNYLHKNICKGLNKTV